MLRQRSKNELHGTVCRAASLPFMRSQFMLLLCVLLLVPGCGQDADPDLAMQAYVNSLHEIHHLLETIHDEASYLRAKPELIRLWRESEQLHLRFGTEFSVEDVSDARTAESEAADKAITQQLERIASTHQEVARQILHLNQVVQDEVFMELE